MTSLHKPSTPASPKHQKHSYLLFIYLRKRFKYFLLIFIIVCLLLNSSFFELYRHHSTRIINIYYQRNQTTKGLSDTSITNLPSQNNAKPTVPPESVITTEAGKSSSIGVVQTPAVKTEKVYPPYSDELLFEWESPPKPPVNSSEPGYLGSAPVIPEHMKKLADDTYNLFQMNLVASDMMSLNRTLNDSRFPECLHKQYPKKLPQTTVVINFQNEAWSTLLRTVWSIYTKSPRALLKEIILVDDTSTLDHLKQKLDDYVKTIPLPIRILRLKKRAGTTLAKEMAVELVTTPIITFMDAHTECNDGWLEPLLARIAENRKAVVTPIIEFINGTNFALKNFNDVNNMYGTFDWNLFFVWDWIPKRERDRNNGDRTGYINTPEFAGGIFAVDKEFYLDLGGYDGEMVYYGAENIEMSFRVWMCGGSIETIPCSRVPHLGRVIKPYTLPKGLNHYMMLNSARVADVWMDEHNIRYYAFNPETMTLRTDVKKRKELRNRLNCKSFKWYLEKVFPESVYNREYIVVAMIESIAKPGYCIDAYPVFAKVGVNKCSMRSGQSFGFTDSGEIMYNNLCLEASSLNSVVHFTWCFKKRIYQSFMYDNQTNVMKHQDGTYCLTLKDDNSLTVSLCNGTVAQRWILKDMISLAKTSLHL